MAAQEEVADAQDQGQSQERARSTIQFPYLDLNDAVIVAKGVHETGGNSCQVDQLAAHLNQSADANMFRVRLGTARIFGLAINSHGLVTLTPLGIRICDPTQEPTARAEAFLTVPLYKQVYDEFKGVNLPPTPALETAMANMGVPPKQKATARQVFQRSATQAGFFAYGSSRLVYPSIKDSTGAPAAGSETPLTTMLKPPETPAVKNGSGGGGGELHPFIQGLIKTLPRPDDPWPIEKRAKWLQAASHVFDLIYAEDTTGAHIDIKVQKETVQ
jgi:hypothetical protein